MTPCIYPVAQDLKTSSWSPSSRGEMKESLIFTRTKHRATVSRARQARSTRADPRPLSQAQRTDALEGSRTAATASWSRPTSPPAASTRDLGHCRQLRLAAGPGDYIHRSGARACRATVTPSPSSSPRVRPARHRAAIGSACRADRPDSTTRRRSQSASGSDRAADRDTRRSHEDTRSRANSSAAPQHAARRRRTPRRWGRPAGGGQGAGGNRAPAPPCPRAAAVRPGVPVLAARRRRLAPPRRSFAPRRPAARRPVAPQRHASLEARRRASGY